MRVLVCGFKGETNSAKLIVDRINCNYALEKLYLVNSFETSKKQLEEVLENEVYDLIITFGQKPQVKTINLEQRACIDGDELRVDYEYNNLKRALNDAGLTVNISNNAGNYLCNHIFYVGLKFIHINKLNTKMIFIHIPSIKNINNIDYLADVFSLYLDNLP